MPTCGMSCQGLLAGTQRQKYKNSEWEGGESEKGRQKERLIQGERDGTLMAPQVQCCISNPVVEEQRGSASINHCISLQLQSLLSVWAASTPPIVHTCKDQELSRGATTGGSSRSPFRLLQATTAPHPHTVFFHQHQDGLTCTLPREEEQRKEELKEPGREVGHQQGGKFYTCGLFCSN